MDQVSRSNKGPNSSMDARSTALRFPLSASNSRSQLQWRRRQISRPPGRAYPGLTYAEGGRRSSETYADGKSTPRVAVGVAVLCRGHFLRRGSGGRAGFLEVYADGLDKRPSAHRAFPVVLDRREPSRNKVSSSS